MRQALHIFKKDVRYLWYELAVTLALVVMFACNLWWIEFMLPIAWVNLTARLIYAEPLPGDRLFWITRPYSWKSLLAAKALFLLLFVNLPMIVADVIVLYRNGFGVLDNLPGIVWSQVLLTSVCVLPVVVLATITTSMIQLVLAGLVLVLPTPLFWYPAQVHGAGPDWQGLNWILYSLMIATFVLVGLIVILRQYKFRRTAIARTLTVGAVLLIPLEAAFFPWDTAFKAQTWFSKLRIDPASVHIALDPGRAIVPQRLWPGPNFMWIQFPIQITGITEGLNTRADAVVVTAEAAAPGSRTRILNGTLFFDGGDKFRLAFQLPRAFFEQMKNQAITIRVSFYLTLLGEAKATTVPRSSQRVTVPGLGRCRVLAEHELLHCLSAFRNSMDSVSLKPASGNFMVASPTSYSPYTAEFGVGLLHEFIHDFNGSPDSVVIVSEVPLAHFRKDAEFRDIRLGDFTVPAFH
jgi:hypothetical protein